LNVGKPSSVFSSANVRHCCAPSAAKTPTTQIPRLRCALCGEDGVFPFVTRITTSPARPPHTLSRC
jgi:hypothetical protein